MKPVGLVAALTGVMLICLGAGIPVAAQADDSGWRLERASRDRALLELERRRLNAIGGARSAVQARALDQRRVGNVLERRELGQRAWEVRRLERPTGSAGPFRSALPLDTSPPAGTLPSVEAGRSEASRIAQQYVKDLTDALKRRQAGANPR
ncbi:MAG: hypothetical protein ACTS3R_04560 [Inquilinaceae bacterium]